MCKKIIEIGSNLLQLFKIKLVTFFETCWSITLHYYEILCLLNPKFISGTSWPEFTLRADQRMSVTVWTKLLKAATG